MADGFMEHNVLGLKNMESHGVYSLYGNGVGKKTIVHFSFAKQSQIPTGITSVTKLSYRV